MFSFLCKYKNAKEKIIYKPWIFLGRFISGFPAFLSVLSCSQLISAPVWSWLFLQYLLSARQKWVPVPVGSAGPVTSDFSLKCYSGTGWHLQKEAAGDKALPARSLVGTVGWIKNYCDVHAKCVLIETQLWGFFLNLHFAKILSVRCNGSIWRSS